MKTNERPTRPCQGCGKPIAIQPPFNGREAIWACMDCYRREHEENRRRREERLRGGAT